MEEDEFFFLRVASLSKILPLPHVNQKLVHIVSDPHARSWANTVTVTEEGLTTLATSRVLEFVSRMSSSVRTVVEEIFMKSSQSMVVVELARTAHATKVVITMASCAKCLKVCGWYLSRQSTFSNRDAPDGFLFF